MNIFDIVMAICLLSDPKSCHEQHLEFDSYKSLNECVFDAQFYIASWQSQNPGWQIKTWRCEYAQQQEDDPDGSGTPPAEPKKS